MSGELLPTPKDRFTALDTLAIVRELRALDRPRVDKVFDGTGGLVSLLLRSPGVGRQELVVGTGRFAALVGSPLEHGEELSALARELRRHLSGAVIVDVADPGGERYLEIGLRRADVAEPLYLIVEFFGAGNLLVARGGRLIIVQHARSWAHRVLRPGAEYRPPPRREDPWSLPASALAEVLAASHRDRASTLAARLAFGGPVAEELLRRASLDPAAPATDAPSATAQALCTARGELLAEIGERPRGYLYEGASGPLDVAPFRAQRWRAVGGVVEREYSSFSEAAMAYFSHRFALVQPPPSPTERRVAELARLREQQHAAVVALGGEAAELRSGAEWVYAHYAEVQGALDERDGGAGRRTPAPVEISGRRLELSGSTVIEAAQALFEQAKRVDAKREGAQAALQATESALHALRSGEGLPVHAPARPGGRPAHTIWFERHRWFLSSEGFVVIGGRDARSNDLIVRRYLNPEDRYVHADIHGAPSVIVKHGPPGGIAPGEPTMREAGQWGAAFSKAWRAGLASADAFWVEADQVSKQGASGEFVARGAWVIHGSKHFLRDLPLELGIGRVEVAGEARWTVAPPPAVQARGELLFVLRPDEERDRASHEVELASALGLSRATLQPMLPAGGFAFRRA